MIDEEALKAIVHAIGGRNYALGEQHANDQRIEAKQKAELQTKNEQLQLSFDTMYKERCEAQEAMANFTWSNLSPEEKERALKHFIKRFESTVQIALALSQTSEIEKKMEDVI